MICTKVLQGAVAVDVLHGECSHVCRGVSLLTII